MKSEAKNKTLIQQDVKKKILEPVPEIVGRHSGRQFGKAHVILFSYTFILPDYLSSGFLLLLVLAAFIAVL